ncbi:peptidoglycan DD-metalloendopeptidase family protein [Rathayibacter sp. VKM Ac-2803]|uniref:M23 family metallopeptidase n=1 Tax=Rathayibacter sp. VKM Ac-2803 TaxID=2609256 RepID=UPI0013580796|nr:M23 family metallopeptidase [Rathayibacter sp. VKM Ac-2803]MWV50056.1 peptidoglycan DD-metalloendopeptidase family protein [Rathayibacter sp. VKM Ac-2803]
MGIDNPEDLSLAALWRLVKRLALANPLNNGSVDRGALTIRSPEGLVVGDVESGADGGGSAKVYGTINITGRLEGDGTLVWDGPAELTGKVDLVGSMHVFGGGQVIVSQEGDANYSMRVLFEDGKGKLVAYGVPVELRAWASTVQLNQNSLLVEGGGGRFQIEDGAVTIERGASRIVIGTDDAIEIRGKDGSFVLMDAGNVRIKQKTGPGLELRDGNAYVSDVPQGTGAALGIEPSGRLVQLSGGGGNPGDPGGPGPQSVKTFYALDHWGDEYGAEENRPNPHRGQDINGWDTGTPVPALSGGTVVLSEWDDALGWVVTIDRGDGLNFGYSHLNAKGIAVGTTVAAGDSVGPIGDTGSLSFGTHVHFTASRVSIKPWEGGVEDPRPYIRAAIAA